MERNQAPEAVPEREPEWRDAGRRGADPQAGDCCRNCGRLAGPHYCGHCGQRLEGRRLSVFSLLGELLSELFSLDGRVVRTLRALARPGRLTQLYLAGKRAPFVRPMRIYVVASLALFSSLLSLQAPKVDEIELSIGGQQVVSSDLPRGEPRMAYTLDAGDSWLIRWWIDDLDAVLDRLREMPPQGLMDEMFAGLKQVLPAALIVFLPFLALALKLLYLRTSALYVDHLVFAAHFQGAVFLALSVAWLVVRLAGLNLFHGMMVYMLVGLGMGSVFLFLALRRVYGQSRRWTLLKLLALMFIYARLLGLVLGLSTLAVILRMEP